MEPELTNKGLELVFKTGQLTESGAMLVEGEQILVFGEVPLIFFVPVSRAIARN